MSETESSLSALLIRQQRAFAKEGIPSVEVRQDRINRAISLIVDHQGRLVEAMNEDFGNRSVHQSMMADVMGSLASLKYAREKVKRWIAPEKRKVDAPLNLMGANAEIRYQPKGVVGAISTWNFPVWVPLSPLGGIFAAGNRCMVKVSEMTPATSDLLQTLVGQYFDEEELALVTGDYRVAEQFSRLPFDHLLFTGSSQVGRQVMSAAAENLVPVTLELGGKSPVIVGNSANIKKVAQSIAVGKSMNVGQVCLAPDYVLIHEKNLNELIAELENAFKEMFPDFLNNPDYSAIINQRHYKRLQGYLEDARDKEAEIWEVNHARENFSQQTNVYKIPPTLVVNPTEDMLVMQEEIFGPILPIKAISHIDDAIDYVNGRPRPLALYYYGKDVKEQEKVLNSTISGGVTINDVIQHVSCEDLPFGGVGNSGIGHYHGVEGFRTFSHARSIYRQSKINLMALAGLVPPYTDKASKVLQGMIGK